MIGGNVFRSVAFQKMTDAVNLLGDTILNLNGETPQEEVELLKQIDERCRTCECRHCGAKNPRL